MQINTYLSFIPVEKPVPLRSPSPCECQPSWTFKEQVYQGCDPKHPDDSTPWCFVKDSSCKTAKERADHPGNSWRHCAPGGCPASTIAVQKCESVSAINLQCAKFAPLDAFCSDVEKFLQDLGSSGKARMVDLKTIAPMFYHASCKKPDLPEQWWDSGDNRPAKQPKDKCLQASSCLSIKEDRGPKFIASNNFCSGKGVQFKYEVDPSSHEQIIEFMDRQEFKPLGAVFAKHREELSKAYSPEFVTKHIDSSFKDSEKVSGETVKLIMDMFKIPGYYASENSEVCLENNVIKNTMKEGQKIFEDDHKVGTLW